METKGKISLFRLKSAGLNGVKIDTCNHSELHVTFTPLENESVDNFIERFLQWINSSDVQIVRHEIFGGLQLREKLLSELNKKTGGIKWPILWSQGIKSVNPDIICGMNLMAVGGTPVTTIKHNGNIVGCSFYDGYAKNFILGELYPNNVNASRAEQVAELFEIIENILESVSLNYSNVIRTWFFLDDINSWYDDFNKVRTTFYKKHRVFDGVVPASTGIAGINYKNSAVMAGAWAVQSNNSSFGYKEVASPLQCPAPCYGSSFSRAVEIFNPEFKRLFISGTASIQQDGKSAFISDINGQINLTMQVVEAILKSRGMTFSDISRSTGYFKNYKDTPAFNDWKNRNSVSDFPIVYTQADVCRPELLFEIEADALVLNKG